MKLSNICESGLSRVHKHMMEHDCAMITAWRNDPLDLSHCAADLEAVKALQERNLRDIKHSKKDNGIDRKFVHELNKINNSHVKAVLRTHGYGVTDVDGTFIENFDSPNAIPVNEDSMFVVNLNDDPKFKEIIAGLGREYCQDSVLFIDKGTGNAYLHGTNNSSSPGLENDMTVGKWRGGHDGQFYTSVSGRPFTFKEEKLSNNANWFMSLVVNYRKNHNLTY